MARPKTKRNDAAVGRGRLELRFEDDPSLECTEPTEDEHPWLHQSPAELRRAYGRIVMRAFIYGIACALFFGSCTVTMKAVEYFAGQCR